MRRVKLVIEYDGTAYHGWQRQPHVISIQEKVEEAFVRSSQKKVKVIGSGRTDAGVHAWGQVAHADIETPLSDDILLKALNYHLPEDIIVKELKTISDRFHSQRSATSKTYHYQILNQPVASPLVRQQCWWMRKPLDIGRMNDAAQFIVGKHDFKAFQNSGNPMKDTVREIYRSEFVKKDPFIVYEITGSGFLKQMIRNLMGVYVRIGHGKLTLHDLERILEGKDRRRAPQGAPPETFPCQCHILIFDIRGGAEVDFVGYRAMNTQKTYAQKAKNVERKWVLVDATDQILGRLSTQIADQLRLTIMLEL